MVYNNLYISMYNSVYESIERNIYGGSVNWMVGIFLWCLKKQGGAGSVAEVKRIMISLPDNLLQEVDGIVASENLNRSEFIREAMKLYIEERKRRIIREQMKKGYIEMAKINLALVGESFSAEEEVKKYYDFQAAEGE